MAIKSIPKPLSPPNPLGPPLPKPVKIKFPKQKSVPYVTKV